MPSSRTSRWSRTSAPPLASLRSRNRMFRGDLSSGRLAQDEADRIDDPDDEEGFDAVDDLDGDSSVGPSRRREGTRPPSGRHPAGAGASQRSRLVLDGIAGAQLRALLSRLAGARELRQSAESPSP